MSEGEANKSYTLFEIKNFILIKKNSFKEYIFLFNSN